MKQKKQHFFLKVVAIGRVKWAFFSEMCIYIPIFTIEADLVFFSCVFHSFTACFPVDPNPHSPVCLKNAVLFSLFFIVVLSSGHGDI